MPHLPPTSPHADPMSDLFGYSGLPPLRPTHARMPLSPLEQGRRLLRDLPLPRGAIVGHGRPKVIEAVLALFADRANRFVFADPIASGERPSPSMAPHVPEGWRLMSRICGINQVVPPRDFGNGDTRVECLAVEIWRARFGEVVTAEFDTECPGRMLDRRFRSGGIAALVVLEDGPGEGNPEGTGFFRRLALSRALAQGGLVVSEGMHPERCRAEHGLFVEHGRQWQHVATLPALRHEPLHVWRVSRAPEVPADRRPA